MGVGNTVDLLRILYTYGGFQILEVGAAGFSAIFFDHSYIFAPAPLDVHHLNDPTYPLDFCGVATASSGAFYQR